MRFITYISLCIVLWIAPIFANESLSPRDLSLGGGNVVGAGNLLEPVSLVNPAGLVAGKSGVLAYYDNASDILGYSKKGTCINWVGNKLAIGLTYNSEGANLFESPQGNLNENFMGKKNLAIGLSLKIKGPVSVGFNFWQNILSHEIQDEIPDLVSSKTITGADLGFLWQGNKLGIGYTIRGLATNETNGLEHSFGLRLGHIDSLAFFLNTTIQEGYSTGLHCGIEAWLLPNVSLRLGRDIEGVYSAGLGVNIGRLQLDYGYKINPYGNTQILSTGYTF